MNESRWKRIKWNDLLYRLLNTWLLLCMLLFGVGNYCAIRHAGIEHVLIGTLILIGLTVFLYTGFRGRLLCIIGAIAVCAALIAFVTPQNMVVFFRHYLDWLLSGTVWLEEEVLLYELVQTILFALLMFILQTIMEHLVWIRYALAISSLLFILFGIFLRLPISHMGVTFLLWYICLTYIEWTKLHWKKERSRELKPYMLWIMPFCILYLLVLSFLPDYQKPYDWKFVKNIYASVKESVTTMVEHITNGDQEDFDIGFAGFSEQADLKGNLLENPQEVMTVKGVTSLKTNVYLTGKMFDTFDGTQWHATKKQYENERLLDTMETLYALRLYEGNANDFMAETKLDIKYRFFQSSFLFAPVKTKSINSSENFVQSTDILFDKKQGYGTKYTVSFFQLNLDQPALYEYMESEHIEDERFWNNMINGYYQNSPNRPQWGDLKAYRENIYDVYCKEVKLSDEVRMILDKAIEDEDTKLGKLKAIERMLTSYSYTTTPGSIPTSVRNESDFMDYFMSKKEGYCSFFATAFILMARAEGIPARYVEGFSVATHGAKEIPVYAKSAHAWPEVYIDGFGWIPFEPTPGYGEMRYTPWNIDGIPYKDTAGGSYNAGSRNGSGTADQEEELEEEIEKRKEQEQIRTYRLGKIIRTTLLTVIIFLIILFLLERMIRKLRYNKMSLDEQFMAEVKKNLWLLSRLHIERSTAETLHELKLHCEHQIPEVKMTFIDHLEDYIYGNQQITSSIIEQTIKEQKQILDWIKEERKWTYYWIRIIM